MVVLIFGLGLMFLGYCVVKFGVWLYKDRESYEEFWLLHRLGIGTILFVGVLMIVLGLGFIFI